MAQNLTRGRVDYLYFRRISRIVVELSRIGPRDWCFLDSVLDSGLNNSTPIHHFYYSESTRLRTQSFSIRLDGECQVGTPVRRYLQFCKILILFQVCVLVNTSSDTALARQSQ